MIFSTPECGQSVINRCKIDEFQLLVLTPSWVSFWMCFGSTNGGQGHQKATSKEHQQNEVLEAPCFKGGSQEASKAPPGSIWERFLDHLGTIFVSFSDIFLVIFTRILEQYVTNKHVQNHKESPKECSRELPRDNFSLRAILH